MSFRRADKISTSELVIKEGWLQKEGGATKSKWQARWFKLQGRTLFYYTKKEESHPQGSINLDEVLDISKIGEHSGKHHCFSLVSTKAKGGSKKVYYLAADSEPLMNEWFRALQSGPSSEPSLRLVKYATVEVFLTQGVRIAGDVPYGILSAISQKVGPEKKKRDNFGWFCDCPIALAMVLNLFAEYSWVPERIYRSSAISGTDNSIQPVIRVIFSKSPPGMDPGRTSSVNESPLLRSGAFDSVSVSSQPVASLIPSGTMLLEGADDELISLMQEFGIPLNLLQVPAE